MAIRETVKKKKDDVVLWKGYPESYSETDLREFGAMIRTCKNLCEAETIFGARNEKGAVIVTVELMGMQFERYVRPYPIELFSHKYDAYSKMIGRDEFVDKKKMEGLSEIAEQMTVEVEISEEDFVKNL